MSLNRNISTLFLRRLGLKFMTTIGVVELSGDFNSPKCEKPDLSLEFCKNGLGNPGRAGYVTAPHIIFHRLPLLIYCGRRLNFETPTNKLLHFLSDFLYVAKY